MKIEKVMKRALDQVVAMAETGNENKYSTKIGNMQIEDDQFEFSLRLKKIQDVKKDPQQSPDFLQARFNDHFADSIKSPFFPGNQCETAKKSGDCSSGCGANQSMKDAIGSLHHWKPNGSGKHPNESVDDYQKSIADAVELVGTKTKDFVKKPPIGIIPQNVFLEKRLFAIQEAKNRFRDSKTVIPSEWLREEKEIMEWFVAPKEPANFATEHRKYINGLIQGMKDEMIKNIDVQMEDVSKEMAQEKELDQEKERSGMIFTISANPTKFPYGLHTDLFFQEMERRKK